MNRYKITITIFILYPLLALSQNNPFLDMAVGKIYPSECPQNTPSPSEERSEPEGYSGHDYGQEPKHYSWDNLYLEPSYPEIIVNPYEGLSEEEEDDE